MGCGCCSGSKEERPLTSRKYSPKVSYTNINLSEHDPSKLIQGYLNEPLLPLEDALKPFDGKINQLSHYIEEAKTKCYFPSPHKLTLDESAAIYIYTMKWGEGCLYDHLQAAWKSEDRARLKPWFKYLKLFRTALDKLPNANTEVWQGTAYNEQLKEQLNSKSASVYAAMGSYCPSDKEVKEHLVKHGDKKTILVAYDSINGKLVKDYTASGYNEVLVWPGMKLHVATYNVDPVTGSVTVHLIPQRKHETKSPASKVSTSDIHFVCQYKGCGNRCPGDHKGNHCHTFASLSHECQHHCEPCNWNRCERCNKPASNLCKCYSCGSTYCAKCCFK